MTSRSFAGKGKIHFRNVTKNLPRYFVGNVSKLDLAIEEDPHEQMDYTSVAGGIRQMFSRIKKVDASFAMYDFKEENVALAVRGITSTSVSGAVVDESITVTALDSLITLAHMGATAVVLKDAAGTTTYVNGVDYRVSSAGITVPAGSVIKKDDVVKASYSYGAGSSVNALVENQDVYEIIFEGLNIAESGKPVVVVLHTCKFSPAKNIALIQDDFGMLDLMATVLASDNGFFQVNFVG